MRKIGLGLLALAFLIPTLAFAQAGSLTTSPTSTVTQSLFGEAADNYLNPYGFNTITNPLFMLAITPANPADNVNQATPLALTLTPTASPAVEAGFATWFDPVYTALYYGFNGYTRGTLAGTNSVSQTQNDTLITDTSGLRVTGKSTVITNGAGYDVVSLQNPTLLFGLKLDTALLGFYNNLKINNTDSYGNWYAVAGGTFGTNVDNSRTEIRDTTGVVSYVSNSESALGTKLQDKVTEDFKAGISLPIDKATLMAGLGLKLATDNTGTNSYATQILKTQVGAGWAAYTPTLVLPGKTPAAIADVQIYSLDSYKSFADKYSLTPSLEAKIKLPFDFHGAAEFVGGISYAPTFDAWATSIMDQNNAALAVNGTGSTTAQSSHTATQTAGTSLIQTVDVQYNAYTATAYTDSSSHAINLPLQVAFTPSESVNFAIGLAPALTVTSQAYTVTGKTHMVTTTNDGDAEAAATDNGDSVVTRDTVTQPTTTSTLRTKFNLDFNTGVQLFVIPKVLRLNIGAGASYTPLNRLDTKTSVSDMATDVTTTVQAGVTTVVNNSIPAPTVGGNEFSFVTTETGNVATVSYKVGLTLFVDPSISFDFLMQNRNALNLTSLMATGSGSGFFDLNNYTIQMTIKLPDAK